MSYFRHHGRRAVRAVCLADFGSRGPRLPTLFGEWSAAGPLDYWCSDAGPPAVRPAAAGYPAGGYRYSIRPPVTPRPGGPSP